MRFETAKTEEQVFAELEQLCASPGYVHVLAQISVRDNLILLPGGLTSEAYAASYTGDRTIRTEFSTLMGLMLKHPISFEQPKPDEMRRMLARTGELLEELHACFNQPMLESLKRAFKDMKGGKRRAEASPFDRADVLREPIFYAGESAYSFQYRDLAVERYADDDDWLLADKAFGSPTAERLPRRLPHYPTRRSPM